MVGQDLVDPLSSAPRFTGWTAALSWHIDDGHRWPDTPPRTWLLERGWITRGGGRIVPCEARQP